MEPLADSADPTDHLKREYLRLKRDIHENDKRIEAAHRQNASQMRTLKALLHKRSTLANQVCQFAQQFTDAYDEHHDSLAEMESLRNLCQTNRDHIRDLTSVITHLQDESDDEKADGPAAGDEQHAPRHGRSAAAAEPQLRPRKEFVELLGRIVDGAAGKDEGKSRSRTARSKYAEGDLARHHRHGEQRRSKVVSPAAASGSGAPLVSGRHDGSQTPHKSPISPFLYALMLVAALTSLPFLCPDTIWHRMFDKYMKTPPKEAPLPPVPTSVWQRARNLCGLQ
ncbi:hypothetical protein V9T40_011996 [Parthenolecanium corni]|uniref:Uncharacterized protein n=1 Tax=Parthenolecanium corni TaxID=536013 RepID=A0AAN9T8S0_9HEMI